MNEGTNAAGPPVLFVHGNGDSSALWTAILWRFESAGYTRDRLRAIDFPYPTARDSEDVPQPGRSSAEEQREQLARMVNDFRAELGVRQVALVASSRGGNAVRGYLKLGGGARYASHAILCGTPNHGVYRVPDYNNEFNAEGTVLRELNAGAEIVPGVAWATIRSARDDKFARPDLGPGQPPGVGYDSPELRGATNYVVDGADHREVAFGKQAFAIQFKFLTGAEATGDIVEEPALCLAGRVTGYAHGVSTNIGVRGARLTVFEVDTVTGARRGGPRYQSRTGPDGRWGGFVASSAACYEFVVEAPGEVARHWFRSPFPRSTDLLHFRLDGEAPPPAGTSVVIFSRPRGYVASGRDTHVLDGRPVPGVPSGVPIESRFRVPFEGPERAVQAELNGETLILRTVPDALVYAEFHY